MAPHSGSGDQPSEPILMKLGKILRPHGIRGEVRMLVYTAYPDQIAHIEEVFIGTEDDFDTYEVETVRFHRDGVLLKFEGIDDRNAAETLRDLLVLVPIELGAPLEEGEYYTYELMGVSVFTDAGEFIGIIEEIWETGANDVFVLRGSQRGEVLIPDTEEVVQSIDLDAQKMIITPIPGLLNE